MIRFFGRWTKRLAIGLAILAVALLGIRASATRSAARRWSRGTPMCRTNCSATRSIKPTGPPTSRPRTRSSRRCGPRSRTSCAEPDRVPDNRYFAGSPIYPRQLRAGLEPLLHPGARRPAGGRGGAPARADRLALQPAPRRASAIATAASSSVGHPPARPRHRAGRADRRRMGGLAGRDATGDAGGAPARSGPSVPLHIVGFSNGGALAMKYALDALEDPHLPRRGPAGADLADDRHHQLRALRRAGRPAGDLSGLRQGRVAQRRAGVQSVQIQLLPGQRRAAILSPDRGAAGSRCRRHARGRAAGAPAADPDLPVCHGFHGQHAGGISALYAHLPANGSELVLFDINRTAKFGPLLRQAAETVLNRLLPAGAAHLSLDDRSPMPRPTQPRWSSRSSRPARPTATDPRRSACPIRRDIYSLSHVAMPVPAE